MAVAARDRPTDPRAHRRARRPARQGRGARRAPPRASGASCTGSTRRARQDPEDPALDAHGQAAPRRGLSHLSAHAAARGRAPLRLRAAAAARLLSHRGLLQARVEPVQAAGARGRARPGRRTWTPGSRTAPTSDWRGWRGRRTSSPRCSPAAPRRRCAPAGARRVGAGGDRLPPARRRRAVRSALRDDPDDGRAGAARMGPADRWAARATVSPPRCRRSRSRTSAGGAGNRWRR